MVVFIYFVDWYRKERLKLDIYVCRRRKVYFIKFDDLYLFIKLFVNWFVLKYRFFWIIMFWVGV